MRPFWNKLLWLNKIVYFNFLKYIYTHIYIKLVPEAVH